MASVFTEIEREVIDYTRHEIGWYRTAGKYLATSIATFGTAMVALFRAGEWGVALLLMPIAAALIPPFIVYYGRTASYREALHDMILPRLDPGSFKEAFEKATKLRGFERYK